MPPSGKGGTKASPAASPFGAGRPVLSREFIAEHKRRRIMDALAELTTERSYEATKISDIVRRAGVARKTLYDNFEGKEEVFLAAFDTARDEMVSRIEEGCSEADGPRERIEAGLGSLLGYVADQPMMAHLALVESISATPTATKRYEDLVEDFVDRAGEVLPRDERLPETVVETLVGGVAWIVYQQLRREAAKDAGDLLPELTDFMMAPYADNGSVAAPAKG